VTKSRGINRPRFVWTPILAELFDKLYPDTRTADLAELLGCAEQQCYARAQRRGLGKSEAFFASPASGRTDGERGAGSRFTKNQVSWNKGKKCPGLGGPTRFQPGHKGAPARAIPVGGYRINPDGYVEVKLNDNPGPYTVRWKPVHRLVWERAHGPIPAGNVVAFKRGQHTTDAKKITPDILECITNAEHLDRNRVPPELRPIVQLRGAITRQINRRLKEQTT
jgi:hypothetical protein